MGGKGSGKRKGVTITVDPPENEAENEPENETEQQQDNARKLAAVMDEVPVDTVVKLWRRDARGGREAYLDTVDAAVFSPEYVKENYGGGDYRFEVRGPTGKGRLKGYQGGDRFTIDRTIPPKYPGVTAPQPEAPPATTTPPGSLGDSINTAIVTLVLDLVQQSRESQRQQAESSRVQNELILAQIRQMQEQGRREERDPLETFKAIADLLKPAQQAAQPLTQLKELLEIQQMLSGEAREPSVAGVITELGPQLLGTINKALDQSRRGPAATVHDPNGATVARVVQPAAPTTEPATTPGSGEPVADLLGKWVPYLVQWATDGFSPEWAAETIRQKIPAGYHPTLAEALAPDDVVTRLVAAYPTLAPFAGWLAEVRQELLAWLNGDDDGSAADDSPG